MRKELFLDCNHMMRRPCGTKMSPKFSIIIESNPQKDIFAIVLSSNIAASALLGLVSRKSRELFGPEKSFLKLRPAYSVKLVFSYVVKGIKIQTTAKFRASRCLRFEDTKRIISPEIRPKSSGTFEKQVPWSFQDGSVTHLESISIVKGSV